MTKKTLYDHQDDVFAVRNGMAAIGDMIEHALDELESDRLALVRFLYRLRWVVQHGLADAERLVKASDTVDPKPGPGPERQAVLLDTLRRADDLVTEARAAELLDQILQAREDYWAIGDETPLPDDFQGPRQKACSAREDAAAAELQQLDVTKPGVALAAFIYGGSLGDGPLEAAGLELNFEDARARAGDYFFERLIVDFVAGMEKRCAGGPVAAVIEKHRRRVHRRTEIREALREAVAATRPRRSDAEEAKAAELLEQALKANMQWFAEEDDSEAQQAAGECDDACWAELKSMESLAPAVMLAQLAYATATDSEGAFGGRDCRLFDIEVGRKTHINGVETDVTLDFMERLRARCAGSPVLAVMERHRAVVEARAASRRIAAE